METSKWRAIDAVETLWQNHLRNEGSVFQNLDRGILDEARIRKHTFEAYKDKIKVENIIIALFKDYKIRKQKVLQKIEHVCRSISLDNQGHSPRPRGKDLIRQVYAYDGLQYRIQFLETWSSHWQPSSTSLERREGGPTHKKLYSKA
jgi:hypothetical protein